MMLLVLGAINGAAGVIMDGWGHGWVDGAAIWAAVAIIVTIAAGNNYSKEKQF